MLDCICLTMNEENCNVVGRIVNCSVEESAMTEGKPDADRNERVPIGGVRVVE